MSAVTTLLHAGKQIVHIDFRGCEPGAFAPVIREATAFIVARPLGTVRALTNVEDVRFDASTVLEMKRFVSTVTPHLKANALVGITGMKAIAFNGLRPLYKVPLNLSSTEEEGMDWLAAQ